MSEHFVTRSFQSRFTVMFHLLLCLSCPIFWQIKSRSMTISHKCRPNDRCLWTSPTSAQGRRRTSNIEGPLPFLVTPFNFLLYPLLHPFPFNPATRSGTLGERCKLPQRAREPGHQVHFEVKVKHFRVLLSCTSDTINYVEENSAFILVIG